MRTLKPPQKRLLRRHSCYLICQHTVPCRMRRKTERNASSLARRITGLAGLKLLLRNELGASATARDKALKMLQDLSNVYHERPDSLVEQVCFSLALAHVPMQP